MIVAIYLRVSHRDSLIGKSLEVQEAECRMSCATREWAVVRVYKDEAKSATSMRRPELKRLLADLKPLGIRAVVVYELDRAFRNLRDQLNVHHDLEAAGVRLVSIVDSIDTATPEGMMQFQLKGMVSEYQARQTGRKIRATLEYKAKNGRWIGPPPFGATVNADGYLTANDDTPVVTLILERYASGVYALRDVAHDLNAEGYTFRDWTGRAGPFLAERVRRIVENRAYIGYVGDKPDCHPPLVDPAVWERANRIRQRHGAGGGRMTVRSETNLSALCGIARCARCGGPLWHQKCGPGHARYDYYFCGTKRQLGACDAPLCRATIADEWVLDALTGLAIPTDWRPLIIERARTLLGQPAVPTIDISARRVALRTLKQRFLDDLIDAAAYEAEKRTIEATVITQSTRTPIDLEGTLALLEDLPALARAADPAHRRALLRTLFAEVWLDRDGLAALRPTAEYLPLAVAVVEYQARLLKADGQHPPQVQQ